MLWRRLLLPRIRQCEAVRRAPRTRPVGSRSVGLDRRCAAAVRIVAGAAASLPKASRWPTSARRCVLGLATLIRVVVLIALATRRLGADRRVGRHAAPVRHRRAADGAVPRRLSGQCAVPDRGLRHRRLAARSEYLAQPADDPRHAMVHFVQCHCRRVGDPGGAARRRRAVSTCAAGCGGGASRCLPCCPIT